MELLGRPRILQGIAGAGLIAASLSSIGHAFPAGHRRTHATGVWAAAVGGGIALGPVAGAGLAAALGWAAASGWRRPRPRRSCWRGQRWPSHGRRPSARLISLPSSPSEPAWPA